MTGVWPPWKGHRVLDASGASGRQSVSRLAIAGLVLLQAVAFGTQSVLIALSQKPWGGFAYDPSSAVVFTEVVKLVVALSSVVLNGQQRLLALHPVAELPGPGGPSRSTSSGDGGLLGVLQRSLVYALPAVLYVVHNNLIFVAHVYLSAPMYQLLSNLKIIAAGVIFCFILRRQLLVIQWMALLQLAAGLACSGFDDSAAGPALAGGRTRGPSAALVSSWHVGFLLVLLLAICSALAVVYSELLMKTSDLPVQVVSTWLHLYGVVASTMAYLATRQPGRSLLDGFTWLVWTLVLANGVLGFVVSFTFRHGGNSVKLYGASLAVPMTCAVSGPLLGQYSGSGFWLGYVQAICALCLFYGDQRMLCSIDADVVAGSAGGGLEQEEAECPKMV
mmetsp:Transcript_75367/g.245133  ORF Transcript_75367/g.245133 Transcript_75367/m.245133 type:complete len:390 (-) Transcript_75367:6-1175(-)